jgi:preprotein translocase subunit SecF
MVALFKKVPNINFMGPRKILFSISGVLLLCTVISIVVHRGFNMSIEFTGGTFAQLKFEKPIQNDLGKIRTIVNELNLGSAEIKTIGPEANNEIQIIVKKQAEGTEVSDEIKTALSQKYPENSFEVRRQEKVGPKVGGEMSTKAFWAVLLGMIGIVIYIWVRFNLPYGVGGVAGIFHDIFITLGVFSLLDKEISIGIIAALLTIAGYSINDTIVVFDRVRENMGGKLHTGNTKNLEDVMNRSINQTLSRTIITSATVLFVLIAFTFFGGDVIRDFSLAMLIGCTCGAYSTMYICSPVVLWWYKKWPAKIA